MKSDPRPYEKRVIAIVYDFDGTLSPGSMQDHNLLPDVGLESGSFWNDVKTAKTKNSSVEILTYMHILLQRMIEQGVSRAQLFEYGQQLPLFEGVETWFSNVDKLVKDLSKGRIQIRHYILSSGLEEMLLGSLVAKSATRIFASSYLWDGDTPQGVARAITDASKPQYIFRVVKGKEDYSEDINDHTPENERPIPFSHVIFIGDGETDIPSMTVTLKNGGHSIAVFDPKIAGREEKCIKLYKAKRVNFYAPADYRINKPLWSRTEIILKKIVADIRLEWADHLFRARIVPDDEVSP